MNDGEKKDDFDAKKIVHIYPLIRALKKLACVKLPTKKWKSCGFDLHIFGQFLDIEHLMDGFIIKSYKHATFFALNHSDMVDEMKGEAMELCVTACEKHAANNEMAARMIKETMDKRFGPAWHVVVGEGFGFEVSYECKNLLYMFFGGNVACCIWKC